MRRIQVLSKAAIRRKEYERIKMHQNCFCGSAKMRGVGFCRACLGRLPQYLRAALFTSDPVKWPDAYDSAKTYLEEGEQR